MKPKARINKNIAKAKSGKIAGGNSGIFSNSGFGQKNDRALSSKKEPAVASYSKVPGAQRVLAATARKTVLVNNLVKKGAK